MRGFNIWPQDVSQPYFQSDGLTWDVYVKPHALSGLDNRKLLKLENPLYGLGDSGDYWMERCSSHVTGEGEDYLRMKTTKGDLSHYFKLNNPGDLEETMGIYIVVSIGVGGYEIEELT